MTSRLRLYATLTLGLTLALPATRVDARKTSDASRLGAFSGAMQYCAENHGGAERRYQRARRHVASEVNDTDKADRRKALAASDSTTNTAPSCCGRASGSATSEVTEGTVLSARSPRAGTAGHQDTAAGAPCLNAALGIRHPSWRGHA